MTQPRDFRQGLGWGVLLGVVLSLAVVVLAALSGGCGPSQRQVTLRATLHGLDAASAAYGTYDADQTARQVAESDARQQAIVAAAATRAEAERQIADYRAARARELAAYDQQRAIVVAAFRTAYHALAAAALDPKHPDLAPVLAAAGDAYTLLKQLGVTLP